MPYELIPSMAHGVIKYSVEDEAVESPAFQAGVSGFESRLRYQWGIAQECRRAL